MKGLSIFIIMLISSLASFSEAEATPSRQKLRAHNARILRYIRRRMQIDLRRHLVSYCRHSHVIQRPLVDLTGRLTLAQRENRIIALTLKIKRLQAYIRYLKKHSKNNKFYKKMMKASYIFSDLSMNIGLFITKHYLEIPWVSLLLPTGLQLIEKLSDKAKIDIPKQLNLHVAKEMDKIIRIIQFHKNPANFSNVVCYLNARSLRNAQGDHCYPDHPLIRQQFMLLKKLWTKAQRKLHEEEHAWWLAPFTEFITHQELRKISIEQNFIVLFSGLLDLQIRFLNKMREVLLNDYKAWGCKGLAPLFKS